MQSRLVSFILALALVVTLLGPTASAPARAAGNTIVFGAAVSLTGRESKEGRLTQEGYDFWKDYVNSHGGLTVGGKKYQVAIKYYDDEDNPQTSARLVEKLINDDKVNFILGPYGSSATFTTAAVVERYKVPMVEANGAAEAIFNQGYKYTFGVLAPARRYLEGILDMGAHMSPPAKTVAISSANDAFSLEVAQGAAAAAKEHGIQVVYQDKYPVTTTDLSTVVSAIKAANPDIILNAGHLTDALLLHKGLKEQNVVAKIYGYSVGPDTPDFRSALGRDANYVFGAAQWSTTAKYRGIPGFIQTSAEYTREFKAKYGHDPDYHNAESTAGCLAFQYAIEKAGSLDPQRVRDALANLDVMTFYGRIKFDQRGLNMYKPMVVNQIQNGELVTVWPAAVAVAKPEYPTPVWARR
jgi:branched-chain amino acid transport system substrate-binding protein